MDLLRAVAGVGMAIFMLVAPHLGIPYLQSVPVVGTGHERELQVDVEVQQPLRLATLDAEGNGSALRVLWAEVEGQKLEHGGQGQGRLDQLRFAAARSAGLRVGNATLQLTPGDEATIKGFEGRWAYAPDGMVGVLRVEGTVLTAKLGQPGLRSLGTGHEELPAEGTLAQHLGDVSVRAGRTAFVSTASDAGDGSTVKQVHARDVRINGAKVEGTRWGEGALDSISFATNAPGVLVGADGNTTLPQGAQVDVADFIGAYVVFFVAPGEARVALEGYAASLHLGQATQGRAPAGGTDLPPVAGFQAMPGSPQSGQAVKFTDLSQDPDGVVLQRAWKFGDGATSAEKNPSHAYDAPGAYTVTLSVTDDHFLASSTSVVLQVLNRPPVAAFAFNPPRPSTLDQVQLVDQSTDADGRLASWRWDFGDGTGSTAQNPQHRFPHVGAFVVNLTVIDDRGAQQALSQVLTVRNLPPQAKFAWQPGDPRSGTAVQFTDQSSDPDGSIVGRRWDFGDGAVSRDASPTHTYTAKGPQKVTLAVTDDQGATSQYDSTVNVLNSPPVADFQVSPDPPAEGNPAQFIDLSKDPDGRIVEWTWSFGDGSVSAQPSPGHMFQQGGDVAVSLTVKDDDGQRSTVMKTFHINRRPVAAWSFLPAAPSTQAPVRFNESSVDPDGTIATWRWDFGDGNSSTERTPTRTFARPGDYHVRLTVTDEQGAWGVLDRVLAVSNAPPLASFTFTPAQPSTNDAIAFNDTSTDPDGRVQQSSWQFGDGTAGTGPQVAKRFGQAGTYPVTLTVTDDSGQSSTVVHVVRVNAAPVPVFTYAPTQPTTASAVQFRDASTDDTGIVAWRWDFGDGGAADTRAPAHTYAQPGLYTVRLSVTDTEGAVSVLGKPLTILDQSPAASFRVSPEQPRAGTAAQFTDLSSDPDGNVASWAWDFGDGGTSTARSPAHTFAAPGLFTVTLRVTDAANNTAQTARIVRVLSGDALALALRVVYPDGQAVDLTRPGITLTMRDTATGALAQVQPRADGTAAALLGPGQWGPADNVALHLSYAAGGVEQDATRPVANGDLGVLPLDVRLKGVVALIPGSGAGPRTYTDPLEQVRGVVLATWSDGTPARGAQAAVSFAYQELGMTHAKVDLSGTPQGAQSGPMDAQGRLPFAVPFTIGSPDSGAYLPGQYRIDARTTLAGVGGKLYQASVPVVFTESPAGLL